TSSVHLDDTTHIEPVRYGRGGNLLGLLDDAMLVDPVPGRSRLRVGLAAVARNTRSPSPLSRHRRPIPRPSRPAGPRACPCSTSAAAPTPSPKSPTTSKRCTTSSRPEPSSVSWLLRTLGADTSLYDQVWGSAAQNLADVVCSGKP
ncbi:MAG: hypothetical protein HOZ81_22190, partial [Streptomyces sp.]|nr:hypothetical protein [Streptomyces sp.]